ncbi:nodulin-related protein 1-like [Zingiber officinale]|uniref:Nodulin-related protein 1 n=1 Tax=Zingiber officinale TaxID=94328 RepID=A0A8J5L5F2_ZINOF|nr:nodulin-related protein 1-like [Zingiber officinale]KAG6506738.1 hypothetical protein ZIOFF_032066 [Zingiber officinale]
MDSFFSKLPAFASGGSDSSGADKTGSGDSHGHQQQMDPTELFSSAKVVADAAKSTFGGAADKVDKSAAAGAASDLLGAVSHYTKVEESSYGKYVEQAETYLEQYRTTGGSAAAAAAAAPKTEEAKAKVEEAAAKTEEAGAKVEEEGADKAPPADDDSGEAQSGGGGLEGYANLAQNLLKK